MPYTNRRTGVFVSNGTGSTVKHGAPIKVSNHVGIAIKQRPVSWKEGLTNQNLIQTNEQFFLLYRGEVQFNTASGEAGNPIAAATVGDKVYITSANALTTTASGNTLYGIVSEVNATNSAPKTLVDPNGSNAGTAATTVRVPSNRIRIDLDAKFAA